MLNKRQYRWIHCLLLAYCCSFLMIQPSQAQTAAVLTVSANTLSETVQLGEQSIKTVTISNPSNNAITPQLYEAWFQDSGTSERSAVPTVQVPLPQQSEKIDPALLRVARANGPTNKNNEFLIYLIEQANLGAAYQIRDWNERGEYVYQILRDFAERSQQDLRRQLDAQGIEYQPFWIVNAILARGSIDHIEAIARHADVAMITANPQFMIEPLEETDITPSQTTHEPCKRSSASSTICWNIERVGANRVWNEFGITGQGIVVGSIDTGVDYTHPALQQNYRGYRGPSNFSHDYNWFELNSTTSAPNDPYGHGTHTTGTIVARGNGTINQPSVGVAPGSRWIAARGCTSICGQSELIAAAQWMLAPTKIDGTDPRPDLRPMIINNSWTGPGGDNWYAGYTMAWRASGIFPVFASGNVGAATCSSVGSPADYSNVLAVGSTDYNDNISGFSRIGPTKDGRVKPDMVAPGAEIYSTRTGGGYYLLYGTSMATPHVAATVALMWSANPSLIGDYDTTYKLLTDNAIRRNSTQCGSTNGQPNNIYGYGSLDSFTTVAKARVDVPWIVLPSNSASIASKGTQSLNITLDASRVPGPGIYNGSVLIYSSLTALPARVNITMTVPGDSSHVTVKGRIIAADTGKPLQGTIQYGQSSRISTDTNGNYSLTLATGLYSVKASALSYATSTYTQAITITTTLPDILLQPDQPRLTVTTNPISQTVGFKQQTQANLTLNNTGSQPLYYQLNLPDDAYHHQRSDEPNGPSYQWVDLPASARTIQLGYDSLAKEIPFGINFPFYGFVYTNTYVLSNGMLTFFQPLETQQAMSRCMPDNETFYYFLAPFRADLDPSRGGTIRYATLNNPKRFVLTFENIPLHTGATNQTYTFQTILTEDGTITYQYKQLAALPNQLDVGIQRTPLDIYSIGCGSQTPIKNNLAIRFTPQLKSSLWMSTKTFNGIIEPGKSVNVPITFTWLMMPKDTVYRGRIEINSSDPINPKTTVWVNFRAQQPPYTQWTPTIVRNTTYR